MTVARWIAVMRSVVVVSIGCSGESSQKKTDGDGDGDVTRPTLPALTSLDDAPRTTLSDRDARILTIPQDPDRLELAGSSLWVNRADGQVAQVDGRRMKVLKLFPTGYSDVPSCDSLGVHADAVWVCAGPNRLMRIDPSTATADEPVTVSALGDLLHLVSVDDHLWVIDESGMKLAGMTTPGNRPEITVDLGGICTEIAGGPQRVWAVCPTDGRVVAVDTRKRLLVADLRLDDPRQVAVAKDVWVSTKKGVAVIDPQTLKVTRLYDVTPGITGSIWAGDDAVWIRSEDHFLTHIDPTSGDVVEVIDAPDLPSGGDVISDGSSVWATAYDDQALVRLSAR